MSNEEDDKQKFPFEFKMATPEIGKTYPIYGMITEIISEQPLIIIINDSIEGTCVVEDPEKINLVKSRAFEPGIFVTKIENQLEDGMYIGTVETIVFGKKQQMVEN